MILFSRDLRLSGNPERPRGPAAVRYPAPLVGHRAAVARTGPGGGAGNRQPPDIAV